MASDAARARAALALCASLAFVGAFLLRPVSGVHVSPDEAANAYFARVYARTGALTAFDPLNVDLGDALAPRSVVSRGGFLAPGGFIGIPALYGAFVRAFGDALLPFLTPALALAAVFAWSALIARLFGARIGFVSALALALHPAWAYWASRSLMPNVPFVSLLILSAFALVCRPLASRAQVLKGFPADLAASGAFLGLALAIRASEVLWLVPAALVAFVAFGRPKPRVPSVAAFLIGASVVAVPMLWLNAQTYGSALATGYGERPVEGIVAAADASAISAWETFQGWMEPLFPFGIHPRNVLRAVRDYGLLLFWWLAPLTIIGFALMGRSRGLASETRRAQRTYHAFFLVSAAYLAVLYGSWVIHDNPDPDAVSIANSYVRYWLPAFVLTTPYVAVAALWIADRAVTARARRLVLGALALSAAGLSLSATFFAPHDGLFSVSATLQGDAQVKAALLSLTDPDAVIVTDRADKLLFPERRVRMRLRDEATYALLPRLENRGPLYYFGITFPPSDLDYLNGEKLVASGLRFVPVASFEESTLYRIEKAETGEREERGGGI